jgi:hypothetical protein
VFRRMDDPRKGRRGNATGGDEKSTDDTGG